MREKIVVVLLVRIENAILSTFEIFCCIVIRAGFGSDVDDHFCRRLPLDNEGYDFDDKS